MNECGCPMCGGDGMLLGQLGNVHQLRCRNCGWNYSVVGGDFSVDEDEDDGQPDEMQEWHDFDPDC